MAATFQFGAIRLDPARRALRKGSHILHVTPKEFDILLYLLQNADRAVSREEMLSKLWPGVVVEEANLTQNIFLLRRALGETDSGLPYIETIPKHGYRIAVPVRQTMEAHWRWKKPLLLILLLLWSALCYWIGTRN